jgi:hypothetical protein
VKGVPRQLSVESHRWLKGERLLFWSDRCILDHFFWDNQDLRPSFLSLIIVSNFEATSLYRVERFYREIIPLGQTGVRRIVGQIFQLLFFQYALLLLVLNLDRLLLLVEHRRRYIYDTF